MNLRQEKCFRAFFLQISFVYFLFLSSDAFTYCNLDVRLHCLSLKARKDVNVNLKFSNQKFSKIKYSHRRFLMGH